MPSTELLVGFNVDDVRMEDASVEALSRPREESDYLMKCINFDSR